MLSKTKLMAVVLLLSSALWAAPTYVWQGPTYAKGPNEGTVCTPGTAFCIIGEESFYQVFSATLATSSTVNQPWSLTIATNYGDPSKTIFPGTPYAYEGALFTNGDFLIMWNNILYGIALSTHDGYQPGNLYKTDSYLTSGAIMGGLVSDVPNPSHNVLLGPGGTLIGAGTMSSSRTGNGVSSAAYTIAVTFTPPSGFLAAGPFSIDFSSYACANGVLHGNSDPPVPPPPTDVPEPTAWVLICSGLGLMTTYRSVLTRIRERY
jgi:hypothetical protein